MLNAITSGQISLVQVTCLNDITLKSFFCFAFYGVVYVNLSAAIFAPRLVDYYSTRRTTLFVAVQIR